MCFYSFASPFSFNDKRDMVILAYTYIYIVVLSPYVINHTHPMTIYVYRKRCVQFIDCMCLAKQMWISTQNSCLKLPIVNTDDLKSRINKCANRNMETSYKTVMLYKLNYCL